MAGMLKVGDKVEIGKSAGKGLLGEADYTVYVSQILDFRDGEVVIAMPISEGHVVPLEIGTSMEAYFYTAQGIYKCNCRITNRGKENNIFMCSIAFTSDLEKFQRRQYYRLECSISAQATVLDLMEIFHFAQNHKAPDNMVNKPINATIVDISGGGVRMLADYKFNRGDYIYLTFDVDMNIGRKRIEIVAKVIQSTQSQKNARFYDTRLQFKEVAPELRDLIVKFIFEQQRKIQQKERG